MNTRLVLVVVAMAAHGAVHGQRIVGTPLQHAIPEPAENVLKRRGLLIQPQVTPGARSSDTNVALAIAYRSAAKSLLEDVGKFDIKDGIATHRKDGVTVNHAVRRVGSTVFVLGPEKGRWVMLPPCRIKQVHPEGLVIDVDGLSVILQDMPAWSSMRVGALVSDWFYPTGITVILRPGSESRPDQTAVALTYGEPVSTDEAASAIQQFIDRRISDSSVLRNEAARLDEIARLKREEAVEKFRKERSNSKLTQ